MDKNHSPTYKARYSHFQSLKGRTLHNISRLYLYGFEKIKITSCFRKMDAQQFRSAAHEMIDFIIDYLENIRSRSVVFLFIK
jgi:hypothetical protein